VRAFYFALLTEVLALPIMPRVLGAA